MDLAGQEQAPEHRVSGCVNASGAVLRSFVPGPDAADRSFWSSLPAQIRADLLAGGEEALAGEWGLLTARGYRAYREQGDRAGYEAIYFQRRRQVNALALAEAVDAQGRFLDALVDGLYLILEESGWQLPAHNAHQRGGVRDLLPDPDNPVVDLFAAETAAQLAVVAHLHGDALDRLSPAILSRIDREVLQRVLKPYLDRHFWWMGNGDEPMNNWTAWCSQNVLISAFTRPFDAELRQKVLQKAAGSLDAFLKDFGEDGACEEGAFYYRHGTLCLFGALNVIGQVAPGSVSALWNWPKLRNMAEFIAHNHVAGRTYINFADASAVLEPCGAREFLAGKAVGSKPLCALAAKDAKANPRPDLPGEINLSYRLLALRTHAEMLAHDVPVADLPDVYYPSCGVFIARDGQFVLAVKAGDNDDGHNHNDVGSLTLYKDGEPVLIDVGVETYTAKTFSPQRYEIWTMQSGFHNLPSFGGVQQQAGLTFAARDVSVDLSEEVASIQMDIAGAYPEAAQLRSYRRTVRLLKGRGIELEDRHDGDLPAVLSLMLRDRPEIYGTSLRLRSGVSLSLEGAGQLKLEEIPVTDARLRLAWPESIYRVLVPLSGPLLRLRIEQEETTG